MVKEIERFSAFVTNTLKFLFKVYFNKMLFLKTVIPYEYNTYSSNSRYRENLRCTLFHILY